MNFSVCPAVAEDAQSIAMLNESCFGLACAISDVEKHIRSIVHCTDERLLVAVYRGAMLGYIHVRVDRRTYRAPRLAVVSIAVAKEYRRQGVAKSLFAAAQEIADRFSCEAIAASVGGSRAAQSFFLAVGCEERLNRKQYVKWTKETERKA